MEKFTRKHLFDINSEQNEDIFVNSMFEVAEALTNSIILQIVEDRIFESFKKDKIQLSNDLQGLVTELKEEHLENFDDQLAKSIHLGLLKCLVPTVDWDCYVDDTENKEGEI